MIILTGSITHPLAPTIVLPNAWVVVENVVIREGQARLIWSCSVWATEADKNNSLPAIGSDGGSVTYDDTQTVDGQLEPAMIANAAGGQIDMSNLAPPA